MILLPLLEVEKRTRKTICQHEYQSTSGKNILNNYASFPTYPTSRRGKDKNEDEEMIWVDGYKA